MTDGTMIYRRVRLREWREARGLTLRTAAARARITHPTWASAEAGRPIALDTAAAIVAFTRRHDKEIGQGEGLTLADLVPPQLRRSVA
jgi:transcriptional regulator with XRE-family HTH domain